MDCSLYLFYSHVNYSVTKIVSRYLCKALVFYSHVNYSVTKIDGKVDEVLVSFTVT